MQDLDSAVERLLNRPNKLDADFIAALQSRLAHWHHGPSPHWWVDVAVVMQRESTNEIVDIVGLVPENRLTSAHLEPVANGGQVAATARVSMATLLKLNDLPSVLSLHFLSDVKPSRGLPPAGAAEPTTQAHPPRLAHTQIAAIIDYGCPFAHAVLRDSSGGTRIAAIWDQDSRPEFAATSGTVPTGFGYGRQLQKADLDRWVTAATSGASVDEDECYRLAEYPAMESSATHGCLALGVLADALAQRGVPNTVPILFVQLPRAVPMAPSRGSIERSIYDGLRYLLACAPNGAQVSVVVDYGSELGPHNGRGWFELAVEEMVASAKADRSVELWVVFASGNSYQTQRRAILFGQQPGAYVPTAQPPAALLAWDLPPDNDSPSWLEVWWPPEWSPGPIQMVSPGGISLTIEIGTAAQHGRGPLDADFAVVWCFKHWVQTSDTQLLIQLPPTSAAADVRCAAGRWTLDFGPRPEGVTGQVDVYTQWGGKNLGFPQRMWPSTLVAISSAAHVTGSGGVVSSACGQRVVVVGGHERWAPADRAAYSADGPVRTLTGATPVNWLAPSEDSPSDPGLLCHASRSGHYMRGRGTSFAAPQVAAALLAIGGLVPSRAGIAPSTHVPDNSAPRLA